MKHRRIVFAALCAAIAATTLASTPATAAPNTSATRSVGDSGVARSHLSTVVAPGQFGSLRLPATLAQASAHGYLYRNIDCNRWDFHGASYIRVKRGRVVAVSGKVRSNKGLVATDQVAKMRRLYRGTHLTKIFRLDYGSYGSGGWRVYSVAVGRGWLDMYVGFGIVSRSGSFLAVRAKSVRSPVDWPTDGC